MNCFVSLYLNYLLEMIIAIINGPNLNMLGEREPNIYGNESFDSYLSKLTKAHNDIEFTYFQSNIEGELINAIQQANEVGAAIVLNPGGYSHTSVALADCIAAVSVPVAEVHVSNIYAREQYRQQLITGSKAQFVISGAGLSGYDLAILFLKGQVVK